MQYNSRWHISAAQQNIQFQNYFDELVHVGCLFGFDSFDGVNGLQGGGCELGLNGG